MDYVDSSVFLRILVKHPGAIELPARDSLATSTLTLVEGRRMIHRLLCRAKIGDTAFHALDELMRGVRIITLDAAILDRASQPMASPIGTLDAIHLASALQSGAARLLTHNVELAIAARAAGLEPVTAP